MTSRDALNNSAVFISSTQCGTAGPPNNVYGWGRVDIFAAVSGGTPTSDSYADSNSDTNGYGNGHSYPTATAHGYSYGNATQTDAQRRRFGAVTEASSDTAAADRRNFRDRKNFS